jgi:hypothetical protein
VSLTPAKHVFASVNDTDNACIAGVIDTVMQQWDLWQFAKAFKGTISKKTSHQ